MIVSEEADTWKYHAVGMDPWDERTIIHQQQLQDGENTGEYKKIYPRDGTEEVDCHAHPFLVALDAADKIIKATATRRRETGDPNAKWNAPPHLRQSQNYLLAIHDLVQEKPPTDWVARRYQPRPFNEGPRAALSNPFLADALDTDAEEEQIRQEAKKARKRRPKTPELTYGTMDGHPEGTKDLPKEFWEFAKPSRKLTFDVGGDNLDASPVAGPSKSSAGPPTTIASSISSQPGSSKRKSGKGKGRPLVDEYSPEPSPPRVKKSRDSRQRG